mmetsp:Transcript_51922/g.127462  ORF Transcript_51922/g.127462 Transcript_51922/m.127462 type:complete len:160 (+) Transcript_51922:117-596(+)|eukprot:CAMPEP_0198311126 /NCGR_PEP_ID=MMETSP1450-20131203/2950_1 /TAXON_ID=753684 ORGANISM="Madagascaria erythrocladiodes, Strain CCMP3234" /NCGR_SAMPLE_ID=MMETSP1450 /ASSEMBLY_ACC=CAM_ASM_001115 /LENGTH=159 /DNA_ID=CAMNT_0044013987 /DNA_START=71 /DNA_END=550 /DNA_ORIENTATION=-
MAAAAAGSKPNEVRRVAVPASLRPANVLVTVHSASDLPAGDRNGLSDPFARVELGKQKRKTRTVSKSLSPQWQQALLFDYDAAATTLTVSVIDADFGRPDDFLGAADVDVALLKDDGQIAQRTVELKSKAGTAAGTVVISVKRGHWSDEQVASLNAPPS